MRGGKRKKGCLGIGLFFRLREKEEAPRKRAPILGKCESLDEDYSRGRHSLTPERRKRRGKKCVVLKSGKIVSCRGKRGKEETLKRLGERRNHSIPAGEGKNKKKGLVQRGGGRGRGGGLYLSLKGKGREKKTEIRQRGHGVHQKERGRHFWKERKDEMHLGR